MKKINVSTLTAAFSVVPFYGYFLAYTYETSYLAVFGIPFQFVQASFSTIFLAVAYFIIILSIIIGVSIFLLPLLNKYEKNFFLYPFIFYCLLAGILCVIVIFLYPENISFLWTVLWTTAILVVYIDFIFPILRARKFSDFKNTIIKAREIKRNEKQSNIIKSENQYFILFLLALFTLFLTYLVGSTFGNTNAKFTTKYYIFNKNSETFALIRSYGEQKIAVRYNENTIIPGDIYIFNSSELRLKTKTLELPDNKTPDTFLKIN